MKSLLTSILCLSFINFGISQQIHTPGEILKIMSDSKLSYQVTSLDKKIECKDFSNKLNYHDCYRVYSELGFSTIKYSPNEKSKPLLDTAEAFFQNKKYDSALFYYKLTLHADSSLYNIMTYIGQLYGIEGNNTNAIIWYKKAIKANFIDYMAHWFLADTYLAINNINDAVDEIVIAQILNRNNKRIKKSLITILEKAKRNSEDWCFNPQIELTKVSENTTSVAFSEKWIGYAMAKALWTYEPGYKESMGVKDGQYSTIEDKECLAALLMGIENSKINIKGDQQLTTLRKAVDKNFLNEYILYEIVLPQTPFIAYQLPEEQLINIRNYFLYVRNK